MRPIRLEIEGFTSFRQKASLDFSAWDLFAVTGPTGAGKTSLVDGLVYALYGRTPRLGERSAAELISQGAARLKVFLEFEAGGRRYQLTRTLKRGGSAALQLDRQSESGEWESIAGKVAEVKEHVQQIVGLDFDGFTRSVILPQGEFDRFLRGDPKQRRQILSALLRLDVYEEMGRRARQKQKDADQERHLIEQHLATAYAEATEENRQALERQLDEIESRERDVTARLQVVVDAQPAAQELRQRRRERDDARQDLARAVRKLDQAREASRQASQQHEQQKNKIRELDDQIARAGFDEKLYLELRALTPAVEVLAERRSHRAQLQAARAARRGPDSAALLAECKKLQKQDQAVQAALEKSARELERLRSLHAASDLRGRLKKGQRCPVCDRIVASPPRAASHAPLERAQREFERRRKEREKCAASLAKAQEELVAAAETQRALADLAAVEREIASLEKRLPPSLDAASVPARLAAQEAARRQREKCADERRRADELCRAAEISLAAAERDVAAAAELEQDRQAAIERAASRIALLDQEWSEKFGHLPPDAGELERLRSELEAVRRKLSQDLAVGRARLETLVRQIAEAAEKRTHAEILRTRAALYNELGASLRADQLVSFIQEEALLRLARDGTRHLETLSSARYSFSAEGDDFLVTDHWNAGEKRSVNTLSGGESFLASLALALALAEGIAEFSTDRPSLRLDSLFLDEGFSTLDPETLEVVVEAIEALTGGDRLIGVISHVAELADRFPARVHVTKSVDGSTLRIE